MGRLQRHPPGCTTVRFTNPTTRQKETGRILAEVWSKEPETFTEAAPENYGWREAAFVAQLIEWANNYRSVRITYYVRPAGAGPVMVGHLVVSTQPL